MKRLLIVIACIVTLAGCASTPLKQDTKLAQYNSAIVKDLVIEDASLSRIEGDELNVFYQDKAVLIKLYTENFKNNLMKTGFFDHVSDEKVIGKAVILESRTSLIDPGIRMITPSRAIVTVKVSDAETEQQIGIYSVSNQSGRQVWTTMMGAIKEDMAALGEGAANDLANKLRN